MNPYAHPNLDPDISGRIFDAMHAPPEPDVFNVSWKRSKCGRWQATVKTPTGTRGFILRDKSDLPAALSRSLRIRVVEEKPQDPSDVDAVLVEELTTTQRLIRARAQGHRIAPRHKTPKDFVDTRDVYSDVDQ